jgi:hypothetical protein
VLPPFLFRVTALPPFLFNVTVLPPSLFTLNFMSNHKHFVVGRCEEVYGFKLTELVRRVTHCMCIRSPADAVQFPTARLQRYHVPKHWYYVTI